MNFQDLKKIETSDFYLDVAFRKAKTRADLVRSSSFKGTRLEKSKRLEQLRIDVIKDNIVNKLTQIVES